MWCPSSPLGFCTNFPHFFVLCFLSSKMSTITRTSVLSVVCVLSVRKLYCDFTWTVLLRLSPEGIIHLADKNNGIPTEMLLHSRWSPLFPSCFFYLVLLSLVSISDCFLHTILRIFHEFPTVFYCHDNQKGKPRAQVQIQRHSLDLYVLNM